MDRRKFLSTTSAAGLLAEAGLAFPSTHRGILTEVAAPGFNPDTQPKYSLKFGVIGLDHDHITGITAALQRGGGELAAVYSQNAPALASFQRRFGPVHVAQSEDEILNHPAIQLVAAAPVPDQRAALGIRVLKHGKDFLSDKPGMISLQELAAVRQAVAQTRHTYGILFSERFEVPAAVKAGELIKAGAIGRVIQTVNLAPHQINQPHSAPRPDWFWDPARYGGILCDIGSHQADQFAFYTGSTSAEITAAQVANTNHPDKPAFQDFGDMVLHGNGGFGYVRVDWFTPDGLGVWGDGRSFILGTEGYIELRKYADIAGRKGGNHLFIVDKQQARYIDCNNLVLPFGHQFIADVINRTHTAQDQEQTLFAMELVLKAQQKAGATILPGT